MASAAKREAVALAAAQADASAARVAPTHPISVHLTPFAPLCEKLPIDHPKRWRTFCGRTPDRVVRATLERVRLAPGAARAEADAAGDVGLMGPVPAELVKLQSGDPQFVPFAIFFDGLTAPDLKAELDALVARGWRPASIEGMA